MTILSQAESIRDETQIGANTAERVGDCLVDIADAITALQPAYCFASGLSAVETVIQTQGQFERAVITTDGFDGNSAFAMSSDFVFTALIAGFYDITVVMSVAIESGTHGFSATFGTEDQASDSPATFDTTLSGGISNPSQVTMKFIQYIGVGETLAIWVTDNTHNHNILVSKAVISAVKIANKVEG